MPSRAFCRCSHPRTGHTPRGCIFCPCTEFQLPDPKPTSRPVQLPLQWYEAELLAWANREVRPYLEDIA